MTKTEIIGKIEVMTEQLSELKRIVFNEEIETLDYSVNWSDAPYWALAHAYDKNGAGFWYGPYIISDKAIGMSCYEPSGFQIGISLIEIHQETWKDSVTLKPLMF